MDRLLSQKPCFCEAVLEVLPSAITPFFLIQVVRIEVELPELEHQFGRRTDRREHDVASTRGPSDGVRRATRKGTCDATGWRSASTLKKDEIPEDSRRSLKSFFLVEADVCPYRIARPKAAQIGIATRDDGKMLASEVPGKAK